VNREGKRSWSWECGDEQKTKSTIERCSAAATNTKTLQRWLWVVSTVKWSSSTLASVVAWRWCSHIDKTSSSVLLSLASFYCRTLAIFEILMVFWWYPMHSTWRLLPDVLTSYKEVAMLRIIINYCWVLKQSLYLQLLCSIMLIFTHIWSFFKRMRRLCIPPSATWLGSATKCVLAAS